MKTLLIAWDCAAPTKIDLLAGFGKWLSPVPALATAALNIFSFTYVLL
jgi:hypothetical protein